MPSKLRYILLNRFGEVYTGNRAIKTMQQLIRWKVLEDAYPTNWGLMSKSRRIQWLAAMLPQQWKVIVVREPARTRKARSTYVRLINKIRQEGVPAELVFEPIKPKQIFEVSPVITTTPESALPYTIASYISHGPATAPGGFTPVEEVFPDWDDEFSQL